MILDWIVFIMIALLVIVGAIISIGFLLKLVYAIFEWIIDL
jgi:hypothetical protein